MFYEGRRSAAPATSLSMTKIRSALAGVLAASAIGALAGPASAAVLPRSAVPGRDYAPSQVVVRYADDPAYHVEDVPAGRTVAEEIARLQRRPSVVSATPNWIAHASWVPNDPGQIGVPGGWQQLQWNLSGRWSIHAPEAWDHLLAVGRPGGRGVVVAVLDTGVAYRNKGRFRKSPDLSSKRIKSGYDFVDHDRFPLDENGHGTHVASTIAEVANNGVGVPGIAYGATIMPVRVLNRDGAGRTQWIAQGIRFAVKHGAQIINLSFEFAPAITSVQIPDIIDALRYAAGHGVIVVAAAGNEGNPGIAYPAAAPSVISVGATTDDGCLANYSNDGEHLDLVAPGGGHDRDKLGCPGWPGDGRHIYQMTFTHSVRAFGMPGNYEGTSMAAPHVSATAALVIASGILGPHPSATAVAERLGRTATDLGAPGRDPIYGWGLVDAARATDPTVP
jgi:serine protease